jgi:chromosome segregation ATPase
LSRVVGVPINAPVSQRHDDVPVNAPADERPRAQPQLASLLTTIAEAVEQYEQASAEQLNAVRLAAQRSFDARVAELSQLGEWRMQTLQSRVDTAEAHLADVDARVGQLVEPVLEQARRAEARAAELAERLATLDQRTAALVGWADGLDTRLSDVAARQEQMQTRLADAEARIERLSGHVVGLVERADRHEAAVEERFAVLTVRADSLRRGEEALTAQVASLAADFAAGDRERSALGEQLAALGKQVEGVSADHIRVLDEQLTATVGEATIARIELERLSQRVGERFDLMQVRVGELEAHAAEQMDVSVAVQLERLDELERAVIELDPDTLVRKD